MGLCRIRTADRAADSSPRTPAASASALALAASAASRPRSASARASAAAAASRLARSASCAASAAASWARFTLFFKEIIASRAEARSCSWVSATACGFVMGGGKRERVRGG